MRFNIRECFEQHRQLVDLSCEQLGDRIQQAAALIIDACKAGGGVFAFGNGGSAADAQHIACELVGRFRRNRRGIRAQALTTDASILTAVANDFDFDRIFARQLEACARPGDVAIGLSTSGNSPNVVEALEKARQMGLRTIALTGRGGGNCALLADVLLDVPSDDTPRIQEIHALVYHILCELVEQAVGE
jgi:D-sedoheptulose 7-phosphate isomerase